MESYKSPHPEMHKSHRAAWLRAAVLGMNDGIVSTSSLMLGVLAASHSTSAILIAGIAGLVAGALSMAVGEYVSVSSQRDSAKADIAIETKSIAANPEQELAELAWIYEQRGLEPLMAKQVAEQLHRYDAVGAHARDELSIDSDGLPNPTQAAFVSAVSFSLGSCIPILATFINATPNGIEVAGISLIGLAISGALGAYIGGGHRLIASLRVFVGGGLAMAITYYIGQIIGGHV